MLEGRLLGPPLPRDAVAVRVVRVGGGSALRRLRLLTRAGLTGGGGGTAGGGSGGGGDREASAVPAAVGSGPAGGAAATAGGQVAWEGVVVGVAKTIHGGGKVGGSGAAYIHTRRGTQARRFATTPTRGSAVVQLLPVAQCVCVCVCVF